MGEYMRRDFILTGLCWLLALPAAHGQSNVLSFSAATYMSSEAASNVSISVLRTGDTTNTVGVSYSTSDGSATAGLDYQPASGTLTFTNGQTVASFSVPLLNDSLLETNETVNLALTNPTGGATLGSPSTAVLTIVDNDTPMIQFSAANFSVGEGDGKQDITVIRTGGTNVS